MPLLVGGEGRKANRSLMYDPVDAALWCRGSGGVSLSLQRNRCWRFRLLPGPLAHSHTPSSLMLIPEIAAPRPLSGLRCLNLPPPVQVRDTSALLLPDEQSAGLSGSSSWAGPYLQQQQHQQHLQGLLLAGGPRGTSVAEPPSLVIQPHSDPYLSDIEHCPSVIDMHFCERRWG